MELQLEKAVSAESLKETLENHFPNYKVKTPFLNKKALNVVDGLSMVIIFPKEDKVKVMSNLNIMHSWYIFVFALLLFFTFVGGFLFYGFLWYQNKQERQVLENEITDFLKSYHG